MGILGKLVQGVLDIATLPVDVAKDVITLGGAITEEEEPYTFQKIKKINKKASEIYDELD